MAKNKDHLNNFISIYINNKKYKVPDGTTIMQACEYAGYRLIRGCGCRGGVCGACSVVYRLPGSQKIETALACQSLAQPDMCLFQITSFPFNKAFYDLEKLEPKTEQVLTLYPEITRCMGCNTCTSSCPMDINVMSTLSEILKGNFEVVVKHSLSCVMCGLCAARCPAGLVPQYYFLLCRRLMGRYLLSAFIDVSSRISEIQEKKYEMEMNRLVKLDTESLKEIYQKAQSDKKLI